MPRHRSRPRSTAPSTPSRSHRQRPSRLISFCYALGLLLIFILSLLLLPADAGLGKLLWSSLEAVSSIHAAGPPLSFTG